jgi:hypothetical protein
MHASVITFTKNHKPMPLQDLNVTNATKQRKQLLKLQARFWPAVACVGLAMSFDLG